MSIKARMRADADWTDIVIRNVSPRGMLLYTPGPPPPPGTYIEIRRAKQVMVGRAVWAGESLIGIRLQDRLQLDALLERRLHSSAALSPGAANAGLQFTARLAERSRVQAGRMQYFALVIALAAGAALIAHALTVTLAEPFAAVQKSLGGN